MKGIMPIIAVLLLTGCAVINVDVETNDHVNVCTGDLDLKLENEIDRNRVQ